MTWTANTPISRPRRINDVQPDKDLNGVKWSDVVGLMYAPELGEFDFITPPQPLPDFPAPGNAGI